MEGWKGGRMEGWKDEWEEDCEVDGGDTEAIGVGCWLVGACCLLELLGNVGCVGWGADNQQPAGWKQQACSGPVAPPPPRPLYLCQPLSTARYTTRVTPPIPAAASCQQLQTCTLSAVSRL